jgi:hypothetical protein
MSFVKQALKLIIHQRNTTVDVLLISAPVLQNSLLKKQQQQHDR